MTEAERYQKRRDYYRAYAASNRDKRRASHQKWAEAHRETYEAAQRASQLRRRGQEPTDGADLPVKRLERGAIPVLSDKMAKIGLKRPANGLPETPKPVDPAKQARIAYLKARFDALKAAKQVKPIVKTGPKLRAEVDQ